MRYKIHRGNFLYNLASYFFDSLDSPIDKLRYNLIQFHTNRDDLEYDTKYFPTKNTINNWFDKLNENNKDYFDENEKAEGQPIFSDTSKNYLFFQCFWDYQEKKKQIVEPNLALKKALQKFLKIDEIIKKDLPVRIQDDQLIINLSYADSKDDTLERLKTIQKSLFGKGCKSTYISYRVKYGSCINTKNDKLFIAREVLVLTKNNNQVDFQFYSCNRDQDSETRPCFEGVVTPSLYSLFLFGLCTSKHNKGRMRICEIHDEKGYHETHNRVRAGVMMSDARRLQAHEPSACKFILIMQDDNIDIIDKVRFISKETLHNDIDEIFAGCNSEQLVKAKTKITNYINNFEVHRKLLDDLSTKNKSQCALIAEQNIIGDIAGYLESSIQNKNAENFINN